MTTTTPIFIVAATPTAEGTFYTDKDFAVAAANALASAAPGQEFLIFISDESALSPVPAPVDTPITPLS